jgi:release factor glutamine methyltransferase
MANACGNDELISIAAALRQGRARLTDAGLDTPHLDAEVILRFLLGIDRATLFVRLRDPIDRQSLSVYRRLLEARAAGTPVAYLIGEREFMGRPFAVSPTVLIPRPETEILVEWSITWLRRRGLAIVLDVGTGSGAIALSIEAEMGSSWPGRIVATEVSAAALEIAARNRSRLGLEHRVELRECSLLTCIDEPVDLLLANLPYLRPDQILDNPQLACEPSLALDGGRDGLRLIRQLLDGAPRVLAPGGAIGIEIDPSQLKSVVALANAAFPCSQVTVLRDLAGLDRHVVIENA